jgi:[CysO sulfur-carrier protein]-thiocarboxylate-dependent cysteine synthase
MRYSDVFEMVGHTPHVRVRARGAEGARIHIKLEGCNPTGSLKDRPCLHMIREVIKSGALRPGMTLLDSSSGNMACSIAYYGRLLGYPATVVVNSKLTADKRNFLLYYGARLIQKGDFTIEGNRHCREMLREEGGEKYCFLDQLHNWDNPRAHSETTAPEILSDFPEAEAVVASLGTGGTLYGVGEYVKEKRPDIKVVTVESAAGTKIPGTGSFDDGDYVTPFIRRGLDEKLFDHTVKIHERDAFRRSAELRDQGVFCGLQTGGVLEAAVAAVNDLKVRGDVVILSGDSGWKNMEKLLQQPAN